eukprot:TRINITY_DN2055_c0_g1_i14.p2 TRINITY_DN2055_c0_g1~~TRINITY_DN2055_c0_g1_i14.p2  ORF type:complete len:285 (-),score=-13.71 TRINITY_DN2055_c0_g1_i14:306-1160(-)
MRDGGDFRRQGGNLTQKQKVLFKYHLVCFSCRLDTSHDWFWSMQKSIKNSFLLKGYDIFGYRGGKFFSQVPLSTIHPRNLGHLYILLQSCDSKLIVTTYFDTQNSIYNFQNFIYITLQRNSRYCITCDLRQKSVKTTLINQFYLYLFTILFLLAILLPQKCIVLFQNDVKNYCLLIAIVDNNLQLIFYYNKKNVNDKKMLLFYVITFAKQLHVVCMCVGLQKIDRKNYLKQLFSFQFYLHNNNEWDLFIYSFLIKIILFINFQLNQKLYVNKWDIFKQKFQIYQ